MTTHTTLTQRYIEATARALPESRRDELRRELDATIADMVEARVDIGEDPVAAERAVLTELGDPSVFAARYADRPLHLIGPAYFPTYRRVLTLLVLWVPATVAAVVLGVELMAQEVSPGRAVGQSASVLYQVAIQVVFWVTVVFVVLERSGVATGARGWTVDDLPDRPARRSVSLSDLAFGLAGYGVAAVFLLGQNYRSGIADGGDDNVPMLNSDLWVTAWPLLLALVAVGAVTLILAYRRGRWNLPLALTEFVTTVAFAAVVGVLALRERLFDPAFLAAVELTSRGEDYLNRGVAIGALVLAGVAVYELIEHRRDLAPVAS